MSTLDELGRDRFRATVSICPECLSVFDGAYTHDRCRDCPGKPVLEVVRVQIATEDVAVTIVDGNEFAAALQDPAAERRAADATQWVQRLRADGRDHS